jgi:hypothetical protein
MENALQVSDVNLVYTINSRPRRAWEALKGAGKADGSVLIVSIDGGCPGVKNVKAGVIGATSQQYPHKMASMALEAIATGKIPPNTKGLEFFDTGAQLITAKPVDGVPSISVDENPSCWGWIPAIEQTARLLKVDREGAETVALRPHRHRFKKGHEQRDDWPGGGRRLRKVLPGAPRKPPSRKRGRASFAERGTFARFFRPPSRSWCSSLASSFQCIVGGRVLRAVQSLAYPQQSPSSRRSVSRDH